MKDKIRVEKLPFSSSDRQFSCEVRMNQFCFIGFAETPLKAITKAIQNLNSLGLRELHSLPIEFRI